MIIRTQKVDLGLGLPEKKKEEVVREPETQCTAVNDGNYFADNNPVRATTPSRTVSQEQMSCICLVKKKKKIGYSTFYEELPKPEPTL